MAASWRISPAWFMPISMTPTRQASGRRRRESGTPTWLLKLPLVLPTTGKAVSSRCAMAALVVVLPALPVTPTMRPPHFWRAHEARFWRACSVSGTRNSKVVVRASLGCTRRSLMPLSTTTAAAPFSIAAGRKSCPSWLGPRSAKYTSPGFCVRVSTLQPATSRGGGWEPAPKIYIAGILCACIHAPTSHFQGRRVGAGAHRARNFLKVQGHGSLGLVIPIPLEHFARHGAVVEVDGLVFQHLISFVALAGEDDDIAFARFLQGSADGRLAIRLDDVGHVEAADADQGVVHDGQRIFGARIVAGEDDEVAALRGCLSHEGTLGAQGSDFVV